MLLSGSGLVKIADFGQVGRAERAWVGCRHSKAHSRAAAGQLLCRCATHVPACGAAPPAADPLDTRACSSSVLPTPTQHTIHCPSIRPSQSQFFNTGADVFEKTLGTPAFMGGWVGGLVGGWTCRVSAWLQGGIACCACARQSAAVRVLCSGAPAPWGSGASALGVRAPLETPLLLPGPPSRPSAAPEVRTGDPYHGMPADMWALGVTLYSFLFGDLPFKVGTLLLLLPLLLLPLLLPTS